MPFLRAGFNARNIATGIMAWVLPRSGGRYWEAAELRRFECGDHFWYGRSFIAWGECCAFRTHEQIRLPWKHQYGLPQSELAS